jgi:hypothetical protein
MTVTVNYSLRSDSDHPDSYITPFKANILYEGTNYFGFGRSWHEAERIAVANLKRDLDKKTVPNPKVITL